MVGLGNVIVLEDVSEVDAFDDLMWNKINNENSNWNYAE